MSSSVSGFSPSLFVLQKDYKQAINKFLSESNHPAKVATYSKRMDRATVGSEASDVLQKAGEILSTENDLSAFSKTEDGVKLHDAIVKLCTKDLRDLASDYSSSGPIGVPDPSEQDDIDAAILLITQNFIKKR